MKEFGLKENTQPEVIPENEMSEEENRSESEKENMISVKFNKEILNLKPEEAGVLAQKGLKFETIAEDYGKLKELAAGNGKSVPEYLEHLIRDKTECRKKELTKQCGGNEEMAEYVLGLENHGAGSLGFEELRKEFPVFEHEEDVPAEVLERAKLKGRLLLDEYLRYRHENEKASRNAVKNQNHAKYASIGSLKTRSGAIDPEAEQFIKGILK